MDTTREIFLKSSLAEAGFDIRREYGSTDFKEAMRATTERYVLVETSDTRDTLEKLIQESRERLSVWDERYSEILQKAESNNDIEPLRVKAALEAAPLVFSNQYLLHAMAGNWNNEKDHALSILKAHAAEVGVGRPGASRADLYQEILRLLSITGIESELRKPSQDSRISAGAFNLPASLNIISYFPERLTGEIIGVSLYLKSCETLPLLNLLTTDDRKNQSILDFGKDPNTGEKIPIDSIFSAAISFVKENPHKGLDDIICGFSWVRGKVEELHEQEDRILNAWLDPREAAGQVIRLRKRDGRLYHGDVSLNGYSMAELLQDESDERDFLEHLEKSPYVRSGMPERSPLLNGLISPRGKMFRVFSDEDIKTLARWISALPLDTSQGHIAAYKLWDSEKYFLPIDVHTEAPHKQIGIREAYTTLLHTEISESMVTYCRKYVDYWLKRAERGVEIGGSPLPHSWQQGKLQEWLHVRHELSKEKNEKVKVPTPSREDVISDILSMAPVTMIDGAWLLGHAHPKLASTPYGYALFETYFDELGNGQHDINHPAIYRDLLQAIYGEFAETASPDFSHSDCFQERDFELPVFWLSIGRFPLTYQPEILGMNLAMELSGVGGGYQRTHQSLKKYGFPTLFVDLHNTIDNVATGHSAWAALSIDSYLSQLPEGERDIHWMRINAGFVALNPPKQESVISGIRNRMRSLI